MLKSIELNKKYVGKEVIYGQNKKAHISELTSYRIEIKTETDGYLVFRTGTGETDNAVSRGDIKFVDESLKDVFLEEYEQYVDSEEGRTDAWLYYSQVYD